jgi:hypothetical protein
MALGPIGSAIYVNQQMASVASEQTARDGRLNLQNFAAAMALNMKDKEIEDVRQAEENKEVDPDREHQKHEDDEEQKRPPKKMQNDDEEGSEGIHHIDIKV